MTILLERLGGLRSSQAFPGWQTSKFLEVQLP